MGEGEEAQVAGGTSPVQARGARRRWAFPAAVAVLVLGGMGMVVQSSFTGGVYDVGVGDLLDQGAAFEGRQVRVAGIIAEGSVRGDVDRLDVTFDVIDPEGRRVTVHTSKVLPDPFAETRETIVEGLYEGPAPEGADPGNAGRIEAARITVKCPSRYQDGEMSEEEMHEYYERSPAGEPTPGDA